MKSNTKGWMGLNVSQVSIEYIILSAALGLAGWLVFMGGLNSAGGLLMFAGSGISMMQLVKIGWFANAKEGT